MEVPTRRRSVFARDPRQRHQALVDVPVARVIRSNQDVIAGPGRRVTGFLGGQRHSDDVPCGWLGAEPEVWQGYPKLHETSLPSGR